jgi:hypothetical protein
MNPSYLKTCKCGNKYIADGRPMCPSCHRKYKLAKCHDLLAKRIAKRQAREERRKAKKNKIAA